MTQTTCRCVARRWGLRHRMAAGCLFAFALVVLTSGAHSAKTEEASKEARSTQASVERQVDSPNLSPVMSSSAATPNQEKARSVDSKGPAVRSNKHALSANAPTPKRQTVASQQNYDKYQLKATNSYQASLAAAKVVEEVSKETASSEAANKVKAASADSKQQAGGDSSPSSSSSSSSLAQKKAGLTASTAYNSGVNKGRSSLSYLKRLLLPSFMTSAAAAAAAGPMAAAAAVVDKHQMSHSRSSQSGGPLAGDGPLRRAPGKIINLLTGGGSNTKKALHESLPSASAISAVPDHAPFFVRKHSGAIDRQAGFASNLLSNPLSLGLIFSAPLIPSLLLTPLAIAGLRPAMSAINNIFGDDEEAASTPASGPLSVLTGPSSPLSSILQGSSISGSGSSSSSSSSPSLALRTVQSFLGAPATTEKPLFNPGMFASSGIQNAAGSLAASALAPSSAANSSPGGQQTSSPVRNFLGGNLFQTAASIISPTYAMAPSQSPGVSGASSSAADSDDGPGLMQYASDMFDKVATYMNSDSKDSVAQASSSTSSVNAQAGSPVSTLVGLSSFSPFQLTSLLAGSPLGSAIAPSGNDKGSTTTAGQKAGFFSTLKNIYELFSSSFLRRQEVGDSNECQQRLICELHQRAMNSKLFRRSIQSNLVELANLDKSFQDQIKNGNIQARIDPDTKAMLSDFMKATNNFKSGRELVNCSKMFPKCSRVMLLSTANAHLAESTGTNGNKAAGKFSNLMKKMKFKSMQQHQSQWKLRKSPKSGPTSLSQLPVAAPLPLYNGQPIDHMQVAPLSMMSTGASTKPGDLTPADSLKLVQQILLMSQQQQQQQQQLSQPGVGQQQTQPQVDNSQYSAPVTQPVQQVIPQQTSSPNQYPPVGQQQQVAPTQLNQQQSMYQQQQQQVMPLSNSYSAYPQYQPSGSSGPMYTDAMSSSMFNAAGPVTTETPYYLNLQQSQQPPQSQQLQPQQPSQLDFSMSQSVGQQQQQQQQQPQQQAAMVNYHRQTYPTSTSVLPEPAYLGGSPQLDMNKKQNSLIPISSTGKVASAA